MRVKIAALLLAVFSSSAWADATQDDWDKLAQPVVEKMAACAHDEVGRMLTTSLSADAVAESAISKCEHHLQPLREVLAKKPFGDSPQQIQATIDQLKSEGHSVIAADVEKRRKKE